MKPKKENRIMCPACGFPKLLFETKEKAIDHIRWNGTQMLAHRKKGSKLDVYWCDACGGYHITSHKNWKAKNNTKKLLKAYEMVKGKCPNDHSGSSVAQRYN